MHTHAHKHSRQVEKDRVRWAGKKDGRSAAGGQGETTTEGQLLVEHSTNEAFMVEGIYASQRSPCAV